MALIQKSKEYNKFTLLPSNRAVNPAKVKKLVAAIQQHNFLQDYPIVINKKFEILDGQHRFLAAKIQNEPVYYVMSENMKGAHVAQVNSLQDKWVMKDYVRHYAAEGLNTYKVFQQKMEEWALPAHQVMEIFGMQGGEYQKALKAGTMDLSHPEKIKRADQLFYALMDLAEYIPFWNNRYFIRSFRKLFFHKGYNHNRMIRKVKMMQRALVPCATVALYTEMLQDTYNYHEPVKNKVNFMF